MLKRKLVPVAFIFMVIPLILAACGGTSTTATSTPTVAPGPAVVTGQASLGHVPDGTATLSWDPTSKTLTVKITLVGLAPSSVHPSHIHTGSCANQGAVLYPLTNISADASGDATATTTIPNVTAGIPATGWYVNVHNGPALAPATQFLPIVCGDVANSTTSTSAAQSVQVTLNTAPAASAGQAAVGNALLTLNGTTLTVTITISGLVPNSSHAAHIHTGSCSAQGNVLYPLNTITADATGSADSTTTITNVKGTIPASGWYVNVHNSTALTTQTGFDPIACGNVVVG
jgi:hypothetical protein